MRHLKIQLGLSASLLASLFALFAVTPWVSTNSGVDLTLYDPTLFAFCTVAIVIIWLDFIVMSDTPSNKLLATAEGKRELLWRLSDNDAPPRQSLPWWNKAVFVWLGYRGAILYAIALTLLTTPFGKPLFALTGFSIPTLITSIVFLVTRFGFEKWATAHPETVERLLNTPEVQDVLEQQPQGA